MVAVTHYETRKIDEAAEYLNNVSGPGLKILSPAPAQPFLMKAKRVAFGRSALMKGETSNWRYRREAPAFTGFMVPLSGGLSCRAANLRHHDAGPSSGVIVRPDEAFTADWTSTRALLFFLRTEGLVDRAEALTGESFSPALLDRMAAVADVSSGAGQALKRNMIGALDEISELSRIGLSSLATAALEETLLNLSVACLFPEVESSLSRPQPDCGPVALREARDYIREHALEPIGLAALARRLNISLRTLQHNFSRYYGLSPRAYLTQRRLETARDLLADENCERTITEIAADCGFSSSSYFALQYRACFGEAPSETLRRRR
ncbi:MAG TPA: AraC family transcriptional regulator [Methylocystis sp.]|nr:AraC family transcriptional regulator [Methylocystis sp.]